MYGIPAAFICWQGSLLQGLIPIAILAHHRPVPMYALHRGRGSTGSAAAAAYIKISEEEIADDYPMPKQYNKVSRRGADNPGCLLSPMDTGERQRQSQQAACCASYPQPPVNVHSCGSPWHAAL
jgi:hypothetical protein